MIADSYSCRFIVIRNDSIERTFHNINSSKAPVNKKKKILEALINWARIDAETEIVDK